MPWLGIVGPFIVLTGAIAAGFATRRIARHVDGLVGERRSLGSDRRHALTRGTDELARELDRLTSRMHANTADGSGDR